MTYHEASSAICHRSPISGIDAWGTQYVATAGYDSQVVLWDARTKSALAFARHDHLVNQCRFSPDGRFLLTASSDYSARVWNVPSLSPVSVLRGHEDDVEMASWSPSGMHVATASRDYRIRIFRRDGTLERTIDGHEADVLSVEWLAEGRELVSSSDDGTVRRWNVATGKELEQYPLGGETDTVVVTASGTIFAGNDRGEILTLRHGKVVALPCHRAGIKRLVLHEETGRLMSASYDRTVKVWAVGDDGGLSLMAETDVPSIVWLRAASFLGADSIGFGSFGSTYAAFCLPQNSWDVSGINDTPGINACGVSDGDVYSVGDAGVVHRNGKAIARLGSLCNFITAWGRRLVTGGQLGVLFDAVTGEVLYQHHSPLNCGVAWETDDRIILVVGAYTGEGLVFEQNDAGEARLARTVPLHDNAIKGLACNGRHLFSVCATSAAAFHDAKTFEPASSIPGAHDKIANGAACLADGRFVSISRDRKLRLWSPGSCQVIASPHDHSIKCVAVLTAARCIATGSYDGKVAIYDYDGGEWTMVEQISRFGISSLVADELNGTFLAASYDGHLYSLTARAAVEFGRGSGRRV